MGKTSRSRSIVQKLSLFLAATLAAQCLLFTGFLLLGGTVERLDQNAMDILSEQTLNRKNYLESDMVQRWSVMEQTQAGIAAAVQSYLADNDMTYDQLAPDEPRTNALLAQLSDELIGMIRRNSTTGAFLILNGSAPLSRPKGDQEYSMAGLHLRDMDPKSTLSTNSDLLAERSSSELVRSLGLTTDINWSPTFTVGAKDDAYYRPLLAALDHPGADPADLGYWTPAHTLDNDQTQIITYSQPLLAPDGTPYGILGVELTVDYLRRQLPYTELNTDKDASYLLVVTTDSMTNATSFQSIVTSGPAAKWLFGEGSLFQFQGEPYYHSIHQALERSSRVGTPVYGSIHYLTLYNSNTPFQGQRWALIGVTDSASLFSFSHSVVRSVLLLCLILLAVSICLALLAGSIFSAPIRALAQDVRALDPNGPVELKSTHVREIDDLAHSIELLSRDVAAYSSRLSQIVELTQIPLAAFQISPDLPSAYYTSDFFPLLGRPEPERPLTCAEFLQVLEDLDRYRDEESEYGDASIYKLPAAQSSACRWLRLQTVRSDRTLLGVLVDVTEEVVEKRRIEYERDYDLLTSLLNRRAFQARLDRMSAHPDAICHGAMLMMDLDNLKYLNDTYGHDCGDEYIRCAADVLRRFTVYSGLAARISGDEFYLFFSGYDQREGLQQVIAQLRSEMAAAAIGLPDGQNYRLRASAGVAWYPEDSSSLQELVRFADFAMYEAKNASKGGLRDFDIQSYQRDSFLLYSRGELNRILDEEAVDFAFQPILCCATGAVLGYEGLMRPRSSALPSPLDLLRIARAQSKLHQIERLTWFKGMEAFHALPGKPDGCLCFLNSLASQALTMQELSQFDARYAPYLGRIVMELTESDELNDDATRLKQQRCQRFGMHIAMDDFGTGYSNDSVLLNISPDFVKVDMGIIRGIDQDKNRQTLFRNLVSLCREMRVQVIAEGVETAEELRTVVALGADYLQGYYLSRPAFQPAPVSEKALQELRAAWNSREETTLPPS